LIINQINFLMEENYNQNSKHQSWNTPENNPQGYRPQENKKVLAGILAILLGGLGVHKFILGMNKEGIILLAITIISIPLMCILIGTLTIYIPALIGLIEGIIYLTKTDEEFYQTYQVNKKAWF